MKKYDEYFKVNESSEKPHFKDVKDILKYYQKEYLFGKKPDSYTWTKKKNPINDKEFPYLWCLEVKVGISEYMDWFKELPDGTFVDSWGDYKF